MKKFTSISMISFLIFYLITSSSCALATEGSINSAKPLIDISLRDIGNNPVREATIILSLNKSDTNPSIDSSKIQKTYLFTNSSGESTSSGKSWNI